MEQVARRRFAEKRLAVGGEIRRRWNHPASTAKYENANFQGQSVKLEPREGFSKENYRYSRVLSTRTSYLFSFHFIVLTCGHSIFFQRISTIKCNLTVYNTTNALYTQLYFYFIQFLLTRYYHRVLAGFLIIIERINGMLRASLNAHVRIPRK